MNKLYVLIVAQYATAFVAAALAVVFGVTFTRKHRREHRWLTWPDGRQLSMAIGSIVCILISYAAAAGKEALVVQLSFAPTRGGELDQSYTATDIAFQLEAKQAIEDVGQRASTEFHLGNVDLKIRKLQDAEKHFQTSATLVQTFSALFNLGVTQRFRGDYAAATIAMQKALGVARARDNKRFIAVAVNELGAIYLGSEQPQKALPLLKEAAGLFDSVDDMRGRAANKLFTGIADEMLGKPNDARREYAEALELFKRSGDDFFQAVVLNSRGTLELGNGQLDAALRDFTDALTFVKQHHDPYGEALVLGNVAAVYGYRGRIAEAIPLYNQQLSIAKETGARESECVALINLSQSYAVLGKSAEALANAGAALQAAGDLHNPGLTAFALNRRGDAFRLLKRYDAAEADFVKSMSLLPSEPSLVLFDAHLGRAETFLAASQVDRARREAKSAHDLAVALAFDFGLGCALVRLGDASFAMGNVGEACSSWQQAETTFRRLGMIGNSYEREAAEHLRAQCAHAPLG